MPSLASALHGRANALNLVRLALALAVIVSHAYPVGGLGIEPRWGGATLGTWAVLGFFCLSGYLVADSRHRLSALGYLLHRCLRLLPGFWVCLVVVGFGFAPLVAHWAGEPYATADGAAYVVANLALRMTTFAVGDTLASVPMAHVWDASLWTLFFEFACYLVLVPAFGWVWARRHTVVVSGGLFVGSIAADTALRRAGVADYTFLGGLVHLLTFFLAGTLVWALRDRLPSHALLAAGSVAILVATSAVGYSMRVGQLPLAYALLWVGGAVRLGWARRTDLSYGVYVYAYPVAQALTVLQVPQAGVVPFVAATVAATLVLAAASWFLVERPALRLRSRPWASRPALAHEAGRPGAGLG